MRESRMLGSVRVKAEWLNYSTNPRHRPYDPGIQAVLRPAGPAIQIDGQGRPTHSDKDSGKTTTNVSKAASSSVIIERAPDTAPTLIEHMRVNQMCCNTFDLRQG